MKENALQRAYSIDRFRSQGHRLIDILADHLQACRQPTIPVLKWMEPEAHRSYWKEVLQKSELLEDPTEFYQKVIENSFHMHHVHNLGHQTSVPALEGVLAGLISDFLNNASPVYETGSVTTVMENLLIQDISDRIGWGGKAGGFLTSGGTLGNLTALLAARNEGGIRDTPPENLAIIVSEEAHFSIGRVARILGLKDSGILKVPVDDEFRVRPDQLENLYYKAVETGKTVFAIVGCAGTTSTVSYDDLKVIGDFCNRKRVWFHVDGAHGGAAIFSNTHKHLMEGLHLADSFIVDFHKMLLTPTLATALVFKENRKSYQAFSQKAPYLWDVDEEEEWFNLAKRTFECTKDMMAFKVFTLIRMHGSELFEQNVDRLYGLGLEMAKLIKTLPDIELATNPRANVVCFRYNGHNMSEAGRDVLNGRIRECMVRDGHFYLVQTTLKDKLYLRVSLMNPLTEMRHLKEFLKMISNTGRQLEAKIGQKT